MHYFMINFNLILSQLYNKTVGNNKDDIDNALGWTGRFTDSRRLSLGYGLGLNLIERNEASIWSWRSFRPWSDLGLLIGRDSSLTLSLC